MCGIVGYVDFKGKTDPAVLDKMVGALRHRGPDGKGTHVIREDNYLIGLGHTRLSILDLSDNGKQPMFFEDLVMVFNGEIYNFKEIRKDLLGLGHSFQSESDSEVILHAYREWGLSCVKRFIGMFAIVIYDSTAKEMVIIRDRAGVKPVYYYQKDDLFIFGSELKVIHEHPAFEKELSTQAVAEYIDFGFINAPRSIFKDCHKLEAGTILKLNLTTGGIQKERYWDAKDYLLAPTFSGTYDEAKDQLHELLRSSFKYRMVSDVPVGVFLSGGIDSSLLSAILKSENFDFKTFTIAFPDGKNEAPHAKKIANHLGTEHYEFDATYQNVAQIIEDIPLYFDEPISDNSTIATTFVSQVARKHVTVALSADGGDETFSGYRRHEAYLRYLSTLNKVPGFLRKATSYALKPLGHLMPDMGRGYNHRLSLFSRLVGQSPLNRSSVYMSYFQLPLSIRSKLLLNPHNEVPPLFEEFNDPNLEDSAQPLLWDYQLYLQNNILTKVDRATMTVSLEGREPMLDHRIWEFAASLPMEFKVGKQSKQILRDLLHEYIPDELTNMRKSGFTLPIYDWLRKDLRPLLEETLSDQAIRNSNVFNPAAVAEIKQDFLQGKFAHVDLVMKLVHFQCWYNQWM